MTAGWIADVLGKDEVTINYRSVENLLEAYGSNPMKELKFVKSRYDFETMVDEGLDERYRTDKYFPKDVSFIEAEMPIDFKNEALAMTSETLKEG